MYINEGIFNEHMRALMVARGNYLSAKDKEEKKRYWYLEFRDCDERSFILTMEQLKFGDGGFPTFAEFRDRYNVLMPHSKREAGRQYCGLCTNGTVLYRGVSKAGEVLDMAAGCSSCSPNRDIQVKPHTLFRDRLGYLRTVEALARDRESGYLNQANDPDIKMEFINPAPALIEVPY